MSTSLLILLLPVIVHTATAIPAGLVLMLVLRCRNQ